MTLMMLGPSTPARLESGRSSMSYQIRYFRICQASATSVFQKPLGSKNGSSYPPVGSLEQVSCTYAFANSSPAFGGTLFYHYISSVLLSP